MSCMKRRELTEEEKGEAQRLSQAWLDYKAKHKGVTQEWLGAESGLGTQGAVGQYLRGVIPLNVEALLAMCRVLGVDPRVISPRMANIVDPLLVGAREAVETAGGLGDLLKLTCETAAELRLLSVYRLAGDDGKAAIDITVERVRRLLNAGDGRNHG